MIATLERSVFPVIARVTVAIVAVPKPDCSVNESTSAVVPWRIDVFAAGSKLPVARVTVEGWTVKLGPVSLSVTRTAPVWVSGVVTFAEKVVAVATAPAVAQIG